MRRRLLLDIGPDGYVLTGLPVTEAMSDVKGMFVRFPSQMEELNDPALGLLCSGRAFGGLLAMLSTQISEATGQDVTLTAEEVKH